MVKGQYVYEGVLHLSNEQRSAESNHLCLGPCLAQYIFIEYTKLKRHEEEHIWCAHIAKELLGREKGRAKCRDNGANPACVRTLGNVLWLEPKERGMESTWTGPGGYEQTRQPL